MFGRIYSIDANPKGYHRLVLEVKQPYTTLWKRYNLWKVNVVEKVLEAKLEVGLDLRFTEADNARFPTLSTVEKVLLQCCDQCQAFYEMGDAQVIDCGGCQTSIPREYLDENLQLVFKKEKMYTFSKGITLTFSDDKDTTSWSTCIFENSPFFSQAKELNEKTTYQVRGWVTSSQDCGLNGVKCLLELTHRPE